MGSILLEAFLDRAFGPLWEGHDARKILPASRLCCMRTGGPRPPISTLLGLTLQKRISGAKG
jgi:hypothetical protein